MAMNDKSIAGNRFKLKKKFINSSFFAFEESSIFPKSGKSAIWALRGENIFSTTKSAIKPKFPIRILNIIYLQKAKQVAYSRPGGNIIIM